MMFVILCPKDADFRLLIFWLTDQISFMYSSKDKELRDVGDWRKNVEDKAGMDGRKKMFEAEA